MKPGLAALCSIALSVAAQFALKRGMTQAGAQRAASGSSEPAALLSALLQPQVLLGLALYAAGALIWLSVLSRWDVSKAYPLVGIGFALSALVGLALGEAVSMQRALGIAAICAGTWLVARS
jgi:multidrug transporter EmrE-like cation transporter